MNQGKIHNFFIKSHKILEINWFVVVFLIKLSSVWYCLIITFFGNGWLTALDSNGDRYLTFWGWFFTVAIFLFNLYLAIVDKYYELHNEKTQEIDKISVERDLLRIVNESVNNICKKKLNNQLHEIYKVKYDSREIPTIYTKPCSQIQSILDELSSCASFLMSDKTHRFKEEEIHTSLIYSLPLEDPQKWYTIDEYTASDSDISHQPDSTFKFFIESKQPYIFFNKKQEAFAEHHYFKSELDEIDGNGHLKGSIACFLLNFRNASGVYIKSVLTLSTYRKPIIDEEHLASNINKRQDPRQIIKNACNTLADNIMENLITNYKKRIGIELCNNYMQFLKEHESKAQRPNP